MKHHFDKINSLKQSEDKEEFVRQLVNKDATASTKTSKSSENKKGTKKLMVVSR